MCNTNTNMFATLILKIRKMRLLLKFSLIALFVIGLAACSNDDSDATDNGKARLSLRLMDAPGDYEAVFVDVREVVIKYNDGRDDVTLAINAGVYDLLELTAGVNILLFNDEVPAGAISQIRLVLGDNNSIVVDGQTLPLNTPSAQQSGLKIQVNETLQPGILYEFMLDFDVDKSIVSLGNGSYNLKPVIRANTVAQSGSISGTIVPLGILALVTATDGINEISSYTNLQGGFLLSGVTNGTYTVTIQADVALGLPDVVIPNVVVVTGEVMSLGEININP